jgi:branched-subunit amino acid transport protein
MRRTGILNRIKQNGRSHGFEDNLDDTSVHTTLETVMIFHYILGIGVLLSILLLTVERVWWTIKIHLKKRYYWSNIVYENSSMLILILFLDLCSYVDVGMFLKFRKYMLRPLSWSEFVWWVSVCVCTGVEAGDLSGLTGTVGREMHIRNVVALLTSTVCKPKSRINIKKNHRCSMLDSKSGHIFNFSFRSAMRVQKTRDWTALQFVCKATCFILLFHRFKSTDYVQCHLFNHS